MGKVVVKTAQSTPLSQGQTAHVEWAPVLPVPLPCLGSEEGAKLVMRGVGPPTSSPRSCLLHGHGVCVT